MGKRTPSEEKKLITRESLLDLLVEVVGEENIKYFSKL